MPNDVSTIQDARSNIPAVAANTRTPAMDRATVCAVHSSRVEMGSSMSNLLHRRSVAVTSA